MISGNDRREYLREVYSGVIKYWFTDEDIGMIPSTMYIDKMTILDFLDTEVWKDEDTGKWRFRENEFSRKGQAEKAARKFFKALLKARR